MKSVASNFAKLKPNVEWASLPLFDRTGWKRVRFGDFVKNIGDRAEPKDAQEEIYVGLEHIDPQSLHLHRWGKGSDVTGTKLRFRKGDIIFGRRRAYQRKLAVAEFDGICSAHAMVVRAKQEMVLAEFLPFLMMSDRFMNRAVEISVGSLSPTINWTTLKLEEFDLPPLDQQRRIAEILWAVDEVREAGYLNLTALAALKNTAMQEFTVGNGGKSEWQLSELHTAATFQYGLSCQLGGTGEYPILRMMNYDEELVIANDLKYADMSEANASEFVVNEGDLLFNRTNSADLVGKVGIFYLHGTYLFASYLVRIVTDRSKLLPEFLNYYLNSVKGQAAVRAFATPGASQSNISAGSLKKLDVPIPSIGEQERAVDKLNRICEIHRKARAHLASHENLLKQLVNNIFS